jgi:hypothetical protein
MALIDWLPQFPWEGPPLPRFLGIFWPRLQSGASLPTLSQRYITSIEEEPPGKEMVACQTLAASYANEEKWDITWSPDGLPTQITVHRNAIKKAG